MNLDLAWHLRMKSIEQRESHVCGVQWRVEARERISGKCSSSSSINIRKATSASSSDCPVLLLLPDSSASLTFHHFVSQ